MVREFFFVAFADDDLAVGLVDGDVAVTGPREEPTRFRTFQVADVGLLAARFGLEDVDDVVIDVPGLRSSLGARSD